MPSMIWAGGLAKRPLRNSETTAKVVGSKVKVNYSRCQLEKVSGQPAFMSGPEAHNVMNLTRPRRWSGSSGSNVVLIFGAICGEANARDLALQIPPRSFSMRSVPDSTVYLSGLDTLSKKLLTCEYSNKKSTHGFAFLDTVTTESHAVIRGGSRKRTQPDI